MFIHKINFKQLITFLAISLGVGILSGIVSSAGNSHYNDTAVKPFLSPPSFVFPIVWTILFILMGISMYLVYNTNPEESTKPLIIWALQLAVNFLWPIIFFNFEAYLAAFAWILILWVLIILMIKSFYDVYKPAAYLQIPYLVWVTFAAYLNFATYLLNKKV